MEVPEQIPIVDANKTERKNYLKIFLIIALFLCLALAVFFKSTISGFVGTVPKTVGVKDAIQFESEKCEEKYAEEIKIRHLISDKLNSVPAEQTAHYAEGVITTIFYDPVWDMCEYVEYGKADGGHSFENNLEISQVLLDYVNKNLDEFIKEPWFPGTEGGLGGASPSDIERRIHYIQYEALESKPSNDAVLISRNKTVLDNNIGKRTAYRPAYLQNVSWLLDSTGNLKDVSSSLYTKLGEYFSKAKKVTQAKSYNGSVILTLEDGKEVELKGYYSVEKNNGTVDYTSMQTFLNEKVVNTYVTISLPPETYFLRLGYAIKTEGDISSVSKLENAKASLSNGELLNRKVRAINYQNAYNFDKDDPVALRQMYADLKSEFTKQYIVKKVESGNTILLEDGKIISTIDPNVTVSELLVGKKIKIQLLDEETFIKANLSWTGDRDGFYGEQRPEQWKPYGKIFVSNFTVVN